jgi:hypothetical protein
MTFDRGRFELDVAAAGSRREVTLAWARHFKAIVRLPRSEQLALYAIAEARANTFPSS